MAFLNTPLKSIQGTVISVLGVATMPWYNPSDFPVVPPNPQPTPIQKDYRWRVTIQIDTQTQSSYQTRAPGSYNGQDVTVGLWIANVASGQAWQIITVESKTTFSVTCIVQDIFRYNTFRDTAGGGNGSPNAGTYVIFDIGSTGVPEIDPVPPSGVSSTFGINLQSRFEFINLQYDYPLYQPGNTFVYNDVVAVDTVSHGYVKSNVLNQVVVGRVTSISDTTPGWFTINPVQKIVDNLDFLPGYVGDTIYADLNIPGALTTAHGGPQVYIKLRDNTSSVSISTVLNGTTAPGSVFRLNNIDITTSGTLADIVSAVNLVNAQTGVNATLVLSDTVAQTVSTSITSTYGEPALWANSSYATATINGIPVTFNIASTDAGYTDYARAPQMAQSINNANIPNIVAIAPSSLILQITNTSGGPIDIVNGTPDVNSVPFAGLSSGSGLPLSTIASTTHQIKFVSVDARAINFFDVVGTVTGDIGLVSVENGIKACGLYIEEGLRTAVSTVVSNLAQLNALLPLIGDQAYVVNSVDANGNNSGEWSMWLYNGSAWVKTSNQDSASTDAKSLEYTVTIGSPVSINIGTISTGRRITLITVEVLTPFNAASTLDIGYTVNNPALPAPVPAGLMNLGIIDLTVSGTYSTTSDILFGTDTVQGDVSITSNFSNNGATSGEAQIIVSYV
jgi:hypothetical protein